MELETSVPEPEVGSAGMPWWGTLMLILGALAFFALGRYLFLEMGLRPWLQSRHVKEWHQVPCTVTASRVEVSRVEPEDEPAYDRFDPHVTYVFDHKGTTLTSQRITLWGDGRPSFRTRPEAEAWLASYPVGATMTCLVNPEDPTISVIDPVVALGDLVGGVVFGGAFVLGGLPLRPWGLAVPPLIPRQPPGNRRLVSPGPLSAGGAGAPVRRVTEPGGAGTGRPVAVGRSSTGRPGCRWRAGSAPWR